MIFSVLTVSAPLDVARIRADFPILQRQVNGHPLIYLDNAATAQKPRQVIDALVDFYTYINANVHRGVHTLSVEATDAYEAVRASASAASSAPRTRGDHLRSQHHRGPEPGGRAAGAAPTSSRATRSWRRSLEHHSNLIPWQRVAQDTGAHIRLVPLTPDGTVDLDDYRQLLGPRTRVVAHGARVERAGHDHRPAAISEAGAPRWRDRRGRRRAERAAHRRPTCRRSGIDFLAFSGHKMLGPDRHRRAVGPARAARGDAAFSGRRRHDPRGLRRSRHLGATAREIRRGHAERCRLDRASASRVDYLDELGMANVRAHEVELTAYALDRLARVQDVTVYGPRDPRAAHGRGVVQPRRRAPARRGHDPRRGGHRGAGRPPLLPAAAPLAGRRGHATRELLHLQLAGRSRRRSSTRWTPPDGLYQRAR